MQIKKGRKITSSKVMFESISYKKANKQTNNKCIQTKNKMDTHNKINFTHNSVIENCNENDISEAEKCCGVGSHNVHMPRILLCDRRVTKELHQHKVTRRSRESYGSKFFAGEKPSLLLNEYWGSFLQSTQPGHETDHSPPSRAKVKNGWRYTSILRTAETGTNVPCPLLNGETNSHYLYILLTKFNI
jgi:hypothetical protein